MNTTANARTSGYLGLTLVALLTLNASADSLIFNNSTTDLLTRLSPGSLEVGDQIILGGTERYLTKFEFEYYGLNSANPLAFSGANVEARVRFYENNGAPFNGYGTPNNSFYDSDWFSVGGPTDRNTFVFSAGSDFDAGGLYIPVETMTWSIQFRGMGATDELGVDIYGPATVGLTYPDYWENSGGNWSLKTNSLPMNFAARFTAVPEPSSAALLALGALGLFAARSRGRAS